MSDDAADADAEEGGRDFVTALARGLEVLRHCASAGPDGATLADAARATGTSRAAVRRSLLTMTACGYLRTDGRSYRTTPKVRLLAAGVGRASPAQRAQPILERTSRRLDESVSLAMLDGGDIVYAARAEARRILALDLSVGARLPAFATSMGRVLLAFLAEAELAPILAAPRARRTPRTVVDEARLRSLLGQVREDRHCLVDGELELGLRSLAVPIACADGRVPAALNVSTLAARTPLREIRRTMLPALQEAAAAIAPLFEHAALESGADEE